MKNFFVSYNRADKNWAEWIAWTLEEHDLSVVIQAWDFRPGGNFVWEMQKAATGTERTLLVLSEDYLKAEFTQPEWMAAFAQDPKGEQRKLFPVRVRPCRPEGLLQSVIYVDLVGLPPEEAEKNLLQGIAERAKPAVKPPFPGEISKGSFGLGERVAPRPVPFPGQPARTGGKAAAIWREKLDFLQEQEAIVADPAQRFALRKQIEEARAKVAELGG
jgi:hypothetical protein